MLFDSNYPLSLFVTTAYVVTDQPSHTRPDQNIRRKMILPSNARKADRRCHRVTADADPLFVRVLIRDRRSECPARYGVS